MFFLNSIIINNESLIVIVGSEAYITTAENTTKNSSTDTKVPCDICGLLFDSSDIKEEHEKLEHVEHKRPSGVG